MIEGGEAPAARLAEAVRELPRHFYSLDALRGFAALAVVFYHWPQFFVHRGELTGLNRELLPFCGILGPLYMEGWRAVDLFFCLSGFIFFWLYAERVRRQQVPFREFALLRFSRLYPLHLLTLLFMAAAQPITHLLHGFYFHSMPGDVLFDDGYHFVLNLLLASNWGFERGGSFNNPIWSVSVEVLLYGVFFGLCRWLGTRWWYLGACVAGGYVIWQTINQFVGRGLFSFFVGGLSFYGFIYCWRRGVSRTALRFLAGFTILLWIFIPYNARHNLIYDVYRNHLWRDDLFLKGKDIIGFILLMIPSISYEAVLFPLTLITLALWEAQCGTLGQRFALLGNISYSSYLLHYPLQLTFAAVLLMFFDRSVFYSPIVLLSFFLTLIALSLLSYQRFEIPMQRWLRARLSHA